MTPHLRSLAALSGQTPDRTPTYLPAINCSVASQILGRKVHTGTGSLHYAEVLARAHGDNAHDDFEHQLLIDLRDIHRALNIDVLRMPWRINRKPTKQLDDFTFLFGDPDGPHEVWQFEPRTADFGMIHQRKPHPSTEDWLKDVTAHDIHAAATPEASQANARSQHLDFAHHFQNEFFVVARNGGITNGVDEDALMALALDPELCKQRLLAQADSVIHWARWLAQQNLPHVIFGGGDMANNNGPLYSPQTFRNLLLPAYTKAARELNALNVHFVFCSDGNLGEVASMLFHEAQVPGFGETDRDAAMTTAFVRNHFPNLVVWGNFSSARLLTITPHQFQEESKRIIE
jgi:hypothetical protein